MDLQRNAVVSTDINKLDVPVQLKHDNDTHVFFAGEFSHPGIIENKRLSEVLAHVKEQRDQHHPEPKTKSDKNGYKRRGRKPGRRTDFMNDPEVIGDGTKLSLE